MNENHNNDRKCFIFYVPSGYDKKRYTKQCWFFSILNFRMKEAIEIYKTALKYEPDNADVYYNVCLMINLLNFQYLNALVV